MQADRIVALAHALGKDITSADAAVLARYAELIAIWNAKLDLTAASNETSLAEVLFADAMIAASDPVLVPRGARVLDVGSGAGAPALPLALLRPDLSVTLVEPLRKRIAFLRTAIGTLDLASRVRVIDARVDPAEPAVEGEFDLASARATFAPEAWKRIGLALAPACLVYATHQAPPDPVHAVRYALPSSGAARLLARYER